LNVIVYIDGFNIYHSIKDLAKTYNEYEYLKWQDLSKLPYHFLSKNDKVLKIKFFTAYPTWKPHSHRRHLDYVHILKDLGLEIVLGNFKRKRVFCDNCKQTITKYEEKQTDVNIAIHIIRDVYELSPDIIQVISGDTDLIPPLKFAKKQGIKIHIVAPMNRKTKEFDEIANKKSKIKLKDLKKYFIGNIYTTKDNKTLQCPYKV